MLPYSNANTGAVAKAKTVHEILQGLDVVVNELRKEFDAGQKKIDRKIQFAVVGVIGMAALAYFLPDNYQDSAETWVTFASFGAFLGVLLG